ncbi:CFI-box-CTERM domain-containing protein [Rhodanobacter sp. FW106-PBR-R2A-1-13]|uniref:CFI-box-CTERM domain-containing protein n=1 Tax=Rhodanobacter sp. FW106-PBR-R2A-1-13 TaxID=3454845 RepID=UPI0034E443DD
MSRIDPDSIAATALATLGLCEHQSVLDRRHGKGSANAEQARWLADGSANHERSRLAAVNRPAATDQRCFVATAIYGTDAPQTHSLRRWRDRRLLPSPQGRALVWTYYRVSPWFLRVIGHAPWLTRIVRGWLDRFVDRIGEQP